VADLFRGRINHHNQMLYSGVEVPLSHNYLQKLLHREDRVDMIRLLL